MAKTPARGAASRRLSTSALALAAAAARRFYVEGLTKVEIARQLGVSRFKVARLLADAQEAGLVQIQVVVPSSLDGDLADALRERFGIRAVYVVRPEDDSIQGQRRAVAAFTAGLLEESVTAEDVVGLAWGRSISQLAATLSATLGCRFVQLSGALPRPDVEESAVELVRRAAEATGSSATTFYAPLAVPDAATADALRSQSGISEALAELDRLTKAVVSVGAWRPGESTALDALGDGDREALTAAGVVAEVTGVLVGPGGKEIDALSDRVIGVTGPQLHATPDVIAMACGDLRAEATATVLRSGLVSTLVTHDSLARSVLATT
ncbi:sugar-binding transcriptional regulator [Kineococcus rhizosphaerae]|uniref:Transcriptional regulator n=1 Tax=Kineococcus rhizosphaerae TaxID=559628 RepID=A0A2T0R2K1_9ACTN|nr:sugar-binding domain-containing protein [Kineococcus rhizosphaerae]PRY14014.1 transcriptional regulator [Kineococcus rhizosphaerae]